jgi:hypothetical protein
LRVEVEEWCEFGRLSDWSETEMLSKKRQKVLIKLSGFCDGREVEIAAETDTKPCCCAADVIV